MTEGRRRVLLVQLPIPPLGPGRLAGNVPLAAGYLKMYAELQGLGQTYDITLFPPEQANTLGDRELVQALLAEQPWMVGFSCYMWNIERTLWIAAALKQQRADLWIIVGGPEVTADNDWVLHSPAIDLAVLGEGEQTFAELLAAWQASPGQRVTIPGLWQKDTVPCAAQTSGTANRLSLPLTARPELPAFRRPLQNLDCISSPYLAGILDPADEKMMLLETLRGCVFKCKFCYYPKSYDDLYYVSEAKIRANLAYARQRGAREVVLLDPTLNQGRHFDSFVQLLADGNADQAMTYFGELRAEGITPKTARLLKQARFTEVEVGLQSIDPQAMQLMDRNNNLRAIERGIRAMRAEGIRVKVDLIIGLPGDTVASVRRGMEYLQRSQLYDDVQVFHLAILPGTAFRQEAEALGLQFQSRPPYYIQRTPTLTKADLLQLMQDARDIFAIDWDPLPGPLFPATWQSPLPGMECAYENGLCTGIRLHLDTGVEPQWPPRRAQVLTLWLCANEWPHHANAILSLCEQLLQNNPFTTLQIVLEPTHDPRKLPRSLLQALWSVCLKQPTYLDRYYAMQPGRPIGAKRFFLLLANHWRSTLDADWQDHMKQHATFVWHGPAADEPELEDDAFWFSTPVPACKVSVC